MTDKERLEITIATTLSGLDATYEHYKNKYPIGSQGYNVLSKIPVVKRQVELYFFELNKERQIEHLKEEIKQL